MQHPFEAIGPAQRRQALLALASTAALLLAILVYLYGPLKNAVAPQGMASLETAGTLERLTAMLASWDESTRLQVAFSLGLNFLCLFALINALAMACVMAAQNLAHGVGIALAWGQWAAGLLWAVENSLLAAAVLGHASDSTIAAASAMAVVKFALVGAGLLYAVVVGIVSRVR